MSRLAALATASLWRREVVRFLRQPSRLVGAAGSPLVFWLLIGSGLGRSFRLQGAAREVSYLEYFLPGIMVLVVLFAAIFSTISVIEDRQQGFLQGVLVSPASGTALVLGKVLGGATLAWIQASVFLLLAPFAGVPLSLRSALAAAAVLALLGITLTAVGFVFAWRVNSTQGFHAVMNLVLVPLWLLSGAFFPPTGSPLWLVWVMRINPLTYGVAALRRVLYDDPSVLGPGLPPLGLALAVTAGWGLLALGVGIAGTRRRRIAG